jgi:rod shape-determining protein MreD
MPPLSLRHVYFSLLLAFVCYLLPWSGFGLLLRPDFVLVTLLFWMLRAPHLCNIGTAWTLGLAVDLASGNLVGQIALVYTVTGFFAVQYQRRLVLFNEWQQAGYVLVLLVLSQLIMLPLKLLSGGGLPDWLFFAASLSGLVLWQLLTVTRMLGLAARNAA